MYQIIGGIRAGMGYCGAATVENLKDQNLLELHRRVFVNLIHMMFQLQEKLQTIVLNK